MAVRSAVKFNAYSMLSIITPTFNCKNYVGRCIECVIAEGTEGVEHIIVDGASTDGTVSLIASYAAQYRHIRFVSEPDCGQSDAMNKGISLARFDTISFLNVDDFYVSGTLNRIRSMQALRSRLHFWVGNCVLQSADGRRLSVNRPSSISFGRLLLLTHLFPYPANPSAYFYAREIHDLVGGYRLDLIYSMDLEFILRASKVADVRYFDEEWGIFVLHPTAKTADLRAGQREKSIWRAQAVEALGWKARSLYEVCHVLTAGYEMISKYSNMFRHLTRRFLLLHRKLS